MFLSSVKTDLETWTASNGDFYTSKKYSIGTGTDTGRNYSYFYVDNCVDLIDGGGYIMLFNDINGVSRSEKIVKYAILGVPINFKIWLSVRKLKKHFKLIEDDKKVSSEIDFLKNGLNIFGENFKKEVRKNKLDKISKNT